MLAAQLRGLELDADPEHVDGQAEAIGRRLLQHECILDPFA